MAQAITLALISPLLKALHDATEIQILLASFMSNSKREGTKILYQSRYLALVLIFMPITLIILKSECILLLFAESDQTDKVKSNSVQLAQEYLWFNLIAIILNCFVDTNILFMRHSTSLRKIPIISNLVALIVHCLLGRFLIVSKG